MSFAPGAVVSGGIDLFNLLTIGGEGGYLYEKPSGDNQAINVAFGGANSYFTTILFHVFR